MMRHKPHQNNSPRFTRGNLPEPEPGPTIRRRQPEIDSNFERKICIGMIVSKEFLEKVVPICSLDLFQAPFARRVAEWCLGYYDQYHEAPGLSIEGIYEKAEKGLPQDEADLLKEFLSGLSEEDKRIKEYGFGVEFNLDETRRYFLLTSLKYLQAKIQQAIVTGRPEDSRAAIERHKGVVARIDGIDGQEALKCLSAKEVFAMEIPEPKWAIPNLLPEGLSILGGKPKKGKSLFALNIALAITGKSLALGNLAVESGTVIYLALEDTVRRLKFRMGKMLGERPMPDHLYFFPQNSCFPRMPEGLTHLEAEIKKHAKLRLVIVDTWGRFKPPDKGKKIDPYDVNVEDAGKLKELADRYRIAILVLHHMRKTGSDDIVDTFYGSVGLTATADGLLALVRKGQQPEAVIYVSGRDVEPQEIALKLDPDNLTWENMGAAAEVQSTAHRQAIVDAILNNEAPMTPKAIAQATGLKLDSIHVTLQLMARQGSLTKIDRGQYDAPIDAKLRWRENREKVVPMRRKRGN